mgnify:CR=1 FL=1
MTAPTTHCWPEDSHQALLIGRVWVEGENSDLWHGAVGGGIWITFARPGNTLSLAVASSAERTALYLRAGFAY